jgi:hypothetical protein
MDDIKHFIAKAEPSDADVVSWAVSLLHRHMADHMHGKDNPYFPDEANFPSDLEKL